MPSLNEQDKTIGTMSDDRIVYRAVDVVQYDKVRVFASIVTICIDA